MSMMIFKDSNSKQVSRDKDTHSLHILTLAPSFIKILCRMSRFLTTGKEQVPLQGFM